MGQRFTLNLSNPVNATISVPSATALLVDDMEPPPTISVGSVTMNVGATSTYAVFPVSLAYAATSPVTVAWGTADGTDTSAGGAYTPAWGA